MKKRIFYAASLFALFAMGSCSEDQIIEDTNVPQTEVTDEYFTPVLKADFTPISARASRVNLATGEIEEEPQSRHHVGLDGKANWVDGDTLLVAAVKSIDKNDPNTTGNKQEFSAPLNTFVYSSSDGNFRQVATEEQLKLLKDAEYQWFAVNPGKKLKEIIYNRGSEEGNLLGYTIKGHSFRPTTQSVADPDEHLASMDEMEGECTKIGNPSLTMQHLGALMTFDIVNQTGNSFDLEGIRIESSNLYASINSKNVESGIEFIPYTEVKIDGKCTINAGNSFTVATIVHPFELNQDEKFIVSVKTDQGTFTKEYVMAKYISFDEGTLNSATVEVTAGTDPGADDFVEIPDRAFRHAICEQLGKPDTEPLTTAELETITELYAYDMTISSLKGIEYLTNLVSVEMNNCGISGFLDLSSNTKLEELDLFYNELSSLDLSHNTQLKDLSLSDNKISSLDLSHNTQLKDLSLSDNKISSLDLSSNTLLEGLSLDGNEISSLDLSHNTLLSFLDLNSNKFSSLDLSHNTQLENLHLDDNEISSLDLSSNTLLKQLFIDDNKLSSLDLSSNTKLWSFQLCNNELSSLNLSSNTKLQYMFLRDNKLKELDISNCNKDLGTDEFHKFDVTGNPDLKTIWVWEGFHDTKRRYCEPAVTTELYKVKK